MGAFILILIIIVIIIGSISAMIAYKKGFNSALWFFAGGLAFPLGFIVLLFLPSASDVMNDNEKYERRIKSGNTTGTVFLIIAILIVLIRLIA